jgi:hypothetical protein
LTKQPVNQPPFDNNAYARPNQSWVCGRAADGDPCPLGPNGKGICRAASECAPYQQGDTWICARSRAQGGKCDDGPLPDGQCCQQIPPCQPVRSIMALRGVVSISAFVLAIGVALVFVSLPQRRLLISPGKLSQQHSTVATRCAQCHAVGEGQLSDWIHASFDAEASASQSLLCLKCHAEMSQHAQQPHGETPASLAAVTARIQNRGRSPMASPAVLIASPAHHFDLSCASCHQEHHGAEFTLTQMSNKQCQTCHVESFASFEKGHPPFSHYPHKRRTRIYFDHVSHFGKHFDQKTSVACSQCHQASGTGDHFELRGFEQTCAACHGEQMEADLSPDLVFAAFPAIDGDAMREHGLDIGSWPEDYPAHVEASGELALLTKWLLLSHEDSDVVGRLEGVDLRDLGEATADQLADVEKLAWAIKDVTQDLAQLGQAGIRQRLQQAFTNQASATHIRELVQQVPVDLMSRMQPQWLPGLADELQAKHNGNELPPRQDVFMANIGELVAAEKTTSRTVTSGWYLRGADLSLRYRPTGHADGVLKAILQLAPSHQDDQLFSAFGPGRCLKCHTVDSVEAGRASERQINWRAQSPPNQREFTRFNHAPHTTLMGEDSCASCHKFESKQAPTQILSPTFFDTRGRPCLDADLFSSDFISMAKSDCAKCHSQSVAGNSCVSCHHYHVE